MAIKGIGGFHLACDAGNSVAVAALRARKRRPAKPLAIMLPTATGLPAAAATLLHSPAAPIVLLAKAQVPGLCDEIAPGLAEVGVMLPSNPLQHLLLQALARPIVMTSGNLSGRPPALSNHEALTDLAAIADGLLLHNRDIVQRMDDSLVRSSGEMLRRARGYVPDALPLPPGLDNIPPLLALGADMKNTFCLARGDEAVLSQHFGDLGEEGVEQQWRSALRLMQSIYAFSPLQVAVDAHPGYRSTQWAASMSLPVEPVLHHHAHAAACLAEHRWPLDGGDVIALTLDGIGMGENGALWGGECLRVNYRECEHLGGLPAVALPGGDLAARQPWRNLLAQCLAFIPDWQSYPQTAALGQRNWPLLAQAIERGINSPRASSCGRLFDAVACALDCAPETLSYEGEAACRLEALAASCPGVSHPVTLPWRGDELDLATFWRQWLRWQATPAQKAWAFHDALACGLAALARDRAAPAGSRRSFVAAAYCIISCSPPASAITFLILLCFCRSSFLLAMARSPTVRRWWPPPAGSLKGFKMITMILRQQPRAAALVLGLIAANALAWLWAFQAFGDSGALMAASLLAWGYGLRHAVDADHIAAIDNVTRKMMQQGRRPFGVGAWFSLGHSSIVVLASAAIAATATAFSQQMSWLHETGSVIGTAVSALFLLAMALVNLVILRSVWRSFQAWKRGEKVSDEIVSGGGMMSWLFGKTFRLISRSWQMYLVGFLFGLGFDTATEIGVLGISAAGASSGISIWSIMVFPALFASGMALVDTLDNVLMVGAYGWAFSKPQRKLYYNMTITGTSVVVALFIGGLEALGLLMDKFALSGGVWRWVGALNDNLGDAGFVVVGLFVVCWALSVLNYRWRGYDNLAR